MWINWWEEGFVEHFALAVIGVSCSSNVFGNGVLEAQGGDPRVAGVHGK